MSVSPARSAFHRFEVVLTVVLALAIFVLFSVLAWRDDLRMVPALISFGLPVELGLRELARWSMTPLFWQAVFATAFLGLGLLCAFRGSCHRDRSLFGIALGGVLLSQIAFGWRWYVCGYLLMACASVLILTSARRVFGQKEGDNFWVTRRWEFLLLALILVPSIFFRIYKLNVLPHYWDDELAIFNSATTSWHGTIMLGLRVLDPIGSPGFLWHLGHYLSNTLLGIGVYSERLFGAGLGVLSILVQYFVSRAVFGRTAGLFTLLLCSAATIEFEWSRLPNWHGLPGVVATLVFYCSYRVWSEQRWLLLIPTTICMMLAMLCYPSGILPGLVPVFAGIGFVGRRLVAGKSHRKEFGLLLCLLIVGVPLWRLIEPILYWVHSQGSLRWFPFGGTHLPAVATASTDYFSLISSWANGLSTVFSFMFVFADNPSHWAPLFGSESPRTAIPSITGIGLLVGLGVLAAREFWSPRSLSVFAWIPLAAGAAVLSTEVETRRFGTLIPLAAIVGGYGISKVFEWCMTFEVRRVFKLLAAFVVSLGVWLFLWSRIAEGNFSLPQEIPLERRMTELLKPFVQDGSVVAVASHPFRQWKIFALMLPYLVEKNGEVAWASLDGRKIEDLLRNPAPSLNSQNYQLSALRSQVDSLSQKSSWDRLIVLTDRRLDEAGPAEKERVDGLIRSLTFAKTRTDYRVSVLKTDLEVTIWVVDLSKQQGQEGKQ